MGDFKITKHDAAAALHTSAPIMVTFIVLGTGYGILMQKHGFGPVWSLVSGLIIFSGTVQFVSISMLRSGSVLMAAITALMVAARHIFFSISMIGRYRKEGVRKGYLFYALCDETYAMLSRDDMPEGINVSAYRLLVTLFDQSSWVLGSFLGGWMGTFLAFDSTGIDFAMTALFTTVFIQQWIDRRQEPHPLGAGPGGDAGVPAAVRKGPVSDPRNGDHHRRLDGAAGEDRGEGRRG